MDDTATGVLCSGALVHTSLFAMANVLYGERYINHSGSILAVCVSLAAQSFSHAYIMSR